MKDHHDDYTQNKNINKMQYEAPCAMYGSFCGIGSLLVQDNFLLIKDGVEKSMKSDPTFHPIDGDFEELSLQQILDITDDDHFEDDSFAPTFTPSSKLAFRKSDTLALATDSPLFGNRKMTKPDSFPPIVVDFPYCSKIPLASPVMAVPLKSHALQNSYSLFCGVCFLSFEKQIAFMSLPLNPRSQSLVAVITWNIAVIKLTAEFA